MGCHKVSAGCKHCLGPDTPVLMADMSWKAIADVRAGDEVVGFTEKPSFGQNRVFEHATVVKAWRTTAEAVEITVAGQTIVASDDHRFLAHARPYWREAERLSLASRLPTVGMSRSPREDDPGSYLIGYLAGAITGDGTFRIEGSGKMGKQSYLRVAVLATDMPILGRVKEGLEMLGCTDIEVRSFSNVPGASPMSKVETRRMDNLEQVRDRCLPERRDLAWKAGFLAGIFDTDGSYSGANLRFHQAKDNGVLDQVSRYARAVGFATKRENHMGCPGERVLGGTEDKIRFLSTIAPALTRKTTDVYGRRFPAKTTAKVEGVQRVGKRDLVDIQTTSGTFIAAGIATHNCYAEVLTKKRMKIDVWGLRGGRQRTGKPVWARPRRWDRDAGEAGEVRRVFCASLADVFEDEPGPNEWRPDVFDIIRSTPHLDYQLLTKRPENLSRMLPDDWGEHGWSNVWLGTSIEDNEVVERAELLTAVPAAIHFVSYEPAIGPVDKLNLEGVEWLIAGAVMPKTAR